jgi:hypothetical protein
VTDGAAVCALGPGAAGLLTRAASTRGAAAASATRKRIAVEPDAEARVIMENAQLEEFKHFAMDLRPGNPRPARQASRSPQVFLPGAEHLRVRSATA